MNEVRPPLLALTVVALSAACGILVLASVALRPHEPDMMWLPSSLEVALSFGHTFLGCLGAVLFFRLERIEKRQASENQRSAWSRKLSALLVSSAVLAPFTLGLLVYWIALSAP